MIQGRFVSLAYCLLIALSLPTIVAEQTYNCSIVAGFNSSNFEETKSGICNLTKLTSGSARAEFVKKVPPTPNTKKRRLEAPQPTPISVIPPGVHAPSDTKRSLPLLEGQPPAPAAITPQSPTKRRLEVYPVITEQPTSSPMSQTYLSGFVVFTAENINQTCAELETELRTIEGVYCVRQDVTATFADVPSVRGRSVQDQTAMAIGEVSDAINLSLDKRAPSISNSRIDCFAVQQPLSPPPLYS